MFTFSTKGRTLACLIQIAQLSSLIANKELEGTDDSTIRFLGVLDDRRDDGLGDAGSVQCHVEKARGTSATLMR